MRNSQFSLLDAKSAQGSRQTLARFVEARLNNGVITMIDPADIPNGALARGKNVTVRFDRTARRFGTMLLTPTKPNANTVLGMFFFKLKNGSAYTFRVTKDDLHFRDDDSSWTEITGSGLAGSNNDRFEFVNILDTVIFANNGADNLQKLDLGAGTYAALGNAPKYRHVTGFFNRAVGAARRGVNEVEVGWSADGDPTEWNPAVNETAGSSPILESPSDLSDYISGIFGFTNTAILLRERSIWLVTKKPSPTDPFNFYSVFPGIGCDAPNSVAVIPNGLTWLDTQTKSVWAFVPGGNPERIGAPIERDILKGLDDPANCFAGFDPIENEYTVAIKRAGSTLVTTWTYNFSTKAWTEGEYDGISSVDNVELVNSTLLSSLKIDDLIGKIDTLVGVINDLVPSGSSVSVGNVRLFGKTNGDILVEDESSDTDAGSAFETLIDSKTFSVPSDDQLVQELRIEFVQRKAGSLQILWSDDGGKTFMLYRTVPVLQLPLDKSKIIRTFGPLQARQYTWRVKATDGAFEILSFEIIISKGGDSRI